MPKSKRTAEEVCIAYARIAAEIRALSAKIVPSECTKMATSESHPSWTGPSTPIVACLNQLFSVTHEADGYGGDLYQGKSEEVESEMCERCLESLKAVRDRKEARKRLGAAKRAVEAIGKRLSAEAA